MFYYLEGVDGAGKSTLARHLSNLLDIPTLHRGPIPAHRTFRDEYYSDVAELLKGPGLVLDRGPVSELVYAKIIRGTPSVGSWEDWSDCQALYNAHQVTKIYLQAPIPVLMERIAARGEQPPKLEIMEKLVDKYNQVIDSSWTIVDTSKEKYEDQLGLDLVSDSKRSRS